MNVSRAVQTISSLSMVQPSISRCEREQLASFIEMAINLIDDFDGDENFEDDGSGEPDDFGEDDDPLEVDDPDS
jgi:hypothetical protein